MLRVIVSIVLLGLAGCHSMPGGPGTSPVPSGDEACGDVEALLDDWHAAAAAADFEGYFGAFASDGVFLGTDPGERWTVSEFQDYARPHFERGRAWTCHPFQRSVALSPGADIAWVDELLEHTKYGTLRGTGVLRRDGPDWRIVHYSMTFAVPNDAADAVVEACKSE